jgi:PLP dependent protein
MDAGEKYLEIKEKVAILAKQCGRDPSEITIVAVSKTHPLKEVQKVYDAGCRDFGESRIQEADSKIPALPSDIRWHFVGTLQKNKVRKALGHFDLIHSVDSLELAQKISAVSEEEGQSSCVLLEVRTSGEATKHGLNEKEWKTSMTSVLSLPALKLEGLMTMAPFVDDESVIRSCFARTKLLQLVLQNHAGDKNLFRQLSMGMTHDYPIAIQEGATILRIGTAIFGGR